MDLVKPTGETDGRRSISCSRNKRFVGVFGYNFYKSFQNVYPPGRSAPSRRRVDLVPASIDKFSRSSRVIHLVGGPTPPDRRQALVAGGA